MSGLLDVLSPLAAVALVALLLWAEQRAEDRMTDEQRKEWERWQWKHR